MTILTSYSHIHLDGSRFPGGEFLEPLLHCPDLKIMRLADKLWLGLYISVNKKVPDMTSSIDQMFRVQIAPFALRREV